LFKLSADFVITVPIGFVYSIHDSTEVAIQKMIDASRRMIDMQSQVGEAREGWGINPVIKKHLELEIKTLQNAPRDPDKLRKLLEIKQRQKEEADHIEDTQRLVTEIEMLKVVIFLVCRNRGKEEGLKLASLSMAEDSKKSKTIELLTGTQYISLNGRAYVAGCNKSYAYIFSTFSMQDEVTSRASFFASRACWLSIKCRLKPSSFKHV
jgi:hypothetical protein